MEAVPLITSLDQGEIFSKDRQRNLDTGSMAMRQLDEQPVVLLVEDDDSDQMLVTRAHANFAPNTLLLIARSGEDAIEFLSDEVLLPKLAFVLLDLKLRGKSGFDVLEHIRRLPNNLAVPVVMFSSSAEGSDVARAYQLGVSAYVNKPVDFEEHQACLKEMFEFWLAHNLT